MRREITKAPHMAIIITVIYPPLVCGTISPYPTVVNVIHVHQIADP